MEDLELPLLHSILINENDNCNYMFDDYLNRPFIMQLKNSLIFMKYLKIQFFLKNQKNKFNRDRKVNYEL